MDATAIFKLSYGLFFLGARDHDQSSICVVNTVSQITQEPLRVSVTAMKQNLTHDLIARSGQFSVGVMDETASLEDIAHFGMQSGRNVDKLAGFPVQTDLLGTPLYAAGCCASYACRVTGAIDVGTHTIFLADLVDAHILSDIPPLTYAAYREKKSGKKPQATSSPARQWQCSICHWVYDGDIPFEDLPDDWTCPVCGRPKSVFVQV